MNPQLNQDGKEKTHFANILASINEWFQNLTQSLSVEIRSIS